MKRPLALIFGGLDGVVIIAATYLLAASILLAVNDWGRPAGHPNTHTGPHRIMGRLGPASTSIEVLLLLTLHFPSIGWACFSMRARALSGSPLARAPRAFLCVIATISSRACFSCAVRWSAASCFFG